MKLSENELREVIKLIEAGKPLPDEYRFKLFETDREVELVWNGKTNDVEAAVLPFQAIEHVDEPRAEKDTSAQATLFEYDDRGRQIGGWTNKLIWGDNKYILSSLKNGPMRQEIEDNGGIKLIYIDPPFDVGADFSMDVEIGGETLTKNPNVLEEIAYRDTWGKGADSFIAMIYERLLLMRDLMSDDASIFVHCDTRVNSYIRNVLDEVFGNIYFHNEIVWLRSSSGKTISKNLSRDTDTIYWYSKTENYTVKPVFKPLSGTTTAMYSLDDKDGRGKYRLYPLQKTGGPGPETSYVYTDNSGKEWQMPKKGWRMRYEKLKALENDGRLYLNGNTIAEKAYWNERENEGKLANSLWDDIPNLQGSSTEILGYPTQKPEKLIERVIDMASEKGDIIADFFMGSGTALAVAEKLGRKWVGSDLGKFSIHTARKRMIAVQRKLKAEDKDYRAFEILNLGKYQRQHYIGENQKLKEQDFIDLILAAYKAEKIQGFETFVGQKAGRLVAVGPINMQVSRDFVDAVVKEALEKSISRIDILSFEYEMGLAPHVQEEAKQKGVDLALKIIPPEVFDRRAIEKDQVKFYDVAYIEVKPHIEKRKVAIELIDFSVFYNQDTDEADLKPGQTKVVIRDGQVVKLNKDKDSDIVSSEILTKEWTDWVDYWSVDFNYESRKEIIPVFKKPVRQTMEGETEQKDIKADNIEDKWTGNYIFENEWQDFRTKKKRELDLKTPLHDYAQTGRYKIAVKVVDIFGNDTMKIIEVNV